MNIIVVGCGKIGTTIIENLIAEGHDVTAVDSNSQTLQDICNIYDAMGVYGSGTDCNTLLETGADKTDLFVAATGSDEFNMLSCYLAKKWEQRIPLHAYAILNITTRALDFCASTLIFRLPLIPSA